VHETTVTYLRWIALLPLLGAMINGLFNRRLPKFATDTVAVGSVVGAFALSLKAFLDLRALPVAERYLHDTLFAWMPIGDLRVDVAFGVDPLTVCMILLVTGVGALIHIYSTGYMKGDGGYQRYFAYLNLFIFAMLLLVLGDNLLLLFVGWEGVGLCSYLLIGFWFHDINNSIAGKKAFVVNRIGDFGFLLGMLVIVKALSGHVGDASVLSFRVMAEHTELLGPVATLAGLLLFLGATGKSAQIPLFVWLPDAMAGPTPVSALIHAATMVTAGVYMVARMNFLYALSETALLVIAVVGAATALVAATIALTQTDIKKVLAYSTVSQLGYMFLACGVGAYGVGIFHVLTHAFFKALLFLGAGSVIHAMHHEQNMLKMGALRTALPWTFRTMFVATLAIAGIFPFAGFFSKDEILYNVFLGNVALWCVGFGVALLTAFYMARLIALTFLGSSRVEAETAKHLHESPMSMVAPLLVLAVLSLAGGWIGWPEFMGGSNMLHHWLAPVFAGGHAAAHGADVGHAVEGVQHSSAKEWLLAGVSFVGALLALLFGLRVYTSGSSLPVSAGKFARGVPYRLLHRKYFVDEIYDALIVRPIHFLSDTVLWRVVDAFLIDGILVNGSGRFLSQTGHLFRTLQNGLLRWYVFSFSAGVLLVVVYLIRRGGAS
jgi:NADH-quinone oxidoreductase subunit L